MLIVAALGGNALLRRGESLDAEVAQRNMKVAARVLGQIACEHQLVVTHGNGPQIGLLALQSEAFRDVRTYPLDVLGAESEGMIGYLLERELGNELGDAFAPVGFDHADDDILAAAVAADRLGQHTVRLSDAWRVAEEQL